MASIKRSALIAHSAQAMYSLVNDVASYPQFMDGCSAVEIIEHTEQMMLARLSLKKAGVQVNLTTRNQLTANTSIEMTLQDGPFKSFKGLWLFTALTDSACKLSLDLEFEFKSRSLGRAATGLFSDVANGLVDSLCRRADDILQGEPNENQ
ncbi:MAG: type II toxin-antitoxin system RatA family toxin [Porticoccaceae bacterium]|nr:type II toxin-antitoxin system RatA family toxin [Porticoccaceae bacterium]